MEYRWHGIIKIDTLHYPCQDMSKKHYTNSLIKIQQQQDSPHEWHKPQYRSPKAISEDKLEKLDKQGIKRIQEIVGMFLFYARAVDNTMLMALNAISMRQAAAIEDTAQKITHFLNYAATHPEAAIHYHASDMVLHIHADASYLSKPKGKSRIAAYYFLSDSAINPNKPSS